MVENSGGCGIMGKRDNSELSVGFCNKRNSSVKRNLSNLEI